MRPYVLFYESNTYRFYGAARVLVWLMTHLEQVRPLFVAPSDGILPQRVREAGIETIILPGPEVWTRPQHGPRWSQLARQGWALPAWMAHTRALARLARARQVLGIHANSTRAAILAGPAAHLAGIPLWWHLRRQRPMARQERLAYALADRVICISQGVKQGLGSPPKAIVIPDGIPSTRIRPDASGRALRQRLGWPEEAPVVGMVASLAPNKRQHLFIRMALTLAQTFPQARFLLAGHRPQGAPPDYETHLHQLARPLEEKGHLVFLGWVEDVSQVYAAMDIFVFPSANEGLGLAPIEAMWMGLPVVRTASAGAEETVREGETGFLIPVDDLDALIQRVHRLLQNPHLRVQMGRAGQTLARQEFTARRMAQRMEALFRK